MQSGYGVCCGYGDAVKLSEDDWYYFGSAYKVRVNGVDWIEVTDKAVIKKAGNPFGQVVVWPYSGPGGQMAIRCLLPVSGT